jgi:tetratricopeptide (TPR) repeat protein
MHLVALVLSLFLAAQDTPEIARSLMEEADRAREANRLDDAASKYKRVIDVAPMLTSAYVNLGAVYYRQGKVAEAYDVFVRGTERAPADKTLLMNAAATAQQLGKSAEALPYVDRALEKSARDADLHALRSTILRGLDRNEEALAAVQQAAQFAPNDAKIQFSLGNLLYQLGKKEEAIAAYRRATDLDRSMLRAYYNLGAVLYESGRYDEALKAYRVALPPVEQAFARGEPVDVIHARAFANLGAIYLKQQKWPDAVAAYEKALRLAPDDTTAHYNLGFIYFTTGKNDRAEAEYRKALALDPALPLAYLHLGDMAFRAGRLDDAIKFFRDGMAHFDEPSKRMAVRTMARAQLARGDRDGARASFEEAGDLQSLLTLARMNRQDRRYEDAEHALDRAQQAAPQSAFAGLERVLLAREAGDLAAERIALEALLAREKPRSDLAPLRAELAAVMLKQSDLENARKQLDAVGFRQLAPVAAAVLDAREGKRDAAARALAQLSSPIARGDAGILLWQLGRAAEAKPHLSAARQALPDWNEVTLAAGEIAVAEKRYDDTVDLLSPLKCDSPVCARAKQLVAYARAALAPLEQPAAEPEPTADEPRRTVVIFLPDDRKLAESLPAMLSSLPIPLQPELFRRADDARAFIAANRDRIGIIIANQEFLAGGFAPRYQFSRDGRRTYRRVVIVQAGSDAKSLADLRGKTISAVEALGDAGVPVTAHVIDDLTAAANVLYARTDAALVSENNSLLADRAKDLRVIHTTLPLPLPVVAFAPMPERDRTALDGGLRSVATLSRIATAPPPVAKRELPPLPPPPTLALRVAMEAPRIEIPENLFGEP